MAALMIENVEDYKTAYAKLSPYYIGPDGGLWYTKKDRNAEVPIKLCSFAALIVEETAVDDGSGENKLEYKVTAESNGELLPPVTVAASVFDTMKWPFENWGTRVNILPGQGTKDRIRYAIMEASSSLVRRKTVYGHMGWRRISGKWCYLYHGGAIGGQDVSVDLAKKGLEGFTFPPPEVMGEKFGTASSLFLLECMERRIAVPLLAYTYLAPLCTFLEAAGCAPGFTVFLLGRTQTRKTTAAALFQSHFGAGWTSRRMPASFDDTLNALRAKAYFARDALLLVDDAHPTPNKKEAEKIRGLVCDMAYAWGDRKGRGRCNAAGDPQGVMSPKGLGLITGEDLPEPSESSLSRYLIIPVNAGDIPAGENLTKAQEMAREGDFAANMWLYLNWLAGVAQGTNDGETLPDQLNAAFVRFRAEEMQHGGRRDRLYEAVALLRVGLMMLIRFLGEGGLMSETQAAELEKNCVNDLRLLTREQTADVDELNPTEIFLDALRELLAAKAVCLMPADGSLVEAAPGEIIGFRDREYVYLLIGQTLGEVSKYLEKQGGRFPVSKKTLLQRLADYGYLEEDKSKTGSRRYNRLKWIGGSARRVVFLKAEYLNPPVEEYEL